MADQDFTKLAAHISSLISLPAGEITPDIQINDLALDSMTTVELVVDLQEEYDVVLARDDFYNLRTLGDLAELIWSRLPDHATG
ncbi:acyl carrier protein [Streptomyces sp. NPDC056704]|uniref:acyl carrier protein n=1 Tax=Streptomyces sp. NPDC056704 TaxID=3345917 RepID=UPI003679F2B8